MAKVKSDREVLDAGMKALVEGYGISPWIGLILGACVAAILGLVN